MPLQLEDSYVRCRVCEIYASGVKDAGFEVCSPGIGVWGLRRLKLSACQRHGPLKYQGVNVQYGFEKILLRLGKGPS